MISKVQFQDINNSLEVDAEYGSVYDFNYGTIETSSEVGILSQEARSVSFKLILDSFLENFPHYEEMTESFEDILFEEEEIESWKEDFEDELKEIEEIDDIENAVRMRWRSLWTLKNYCLACSWRASLSALVCLPGALWKLNSSALANRACARTRAGALACQTARRPTQR
jgi:hypothetical protein